MTFGKKWNWKHDPENSPIAGQGGFKGLQTIPVAEPVEVTRNVKINRNEKTIKGPDI